MATIGEVNEISVTEIQEGKFEWKILDFISIFLEDGKRFFSSSFSFAGVSWYLSIDKEGNDEGSNKSKKYIGLYLYRESPGPPIKLEYSLNLKSMDEEEHLEYHYAYNFKRKDDGYGVYHILSRSAFLKRLSSSDVFTVVCTVKYPKSPADGRKVATEKCSYCKIILVTDEDISFHQQKCLNKPIKCPECSDDVILKDWYDHECQIARAEVSEKLLHDFKVLMVNGDHSDVTVKVKGEEFRLHRNILGVRNPFFCSMFKNDMKEKATGIVSIDDCEPHIFHSFIHFIYIGKVDKLCPENVCDLYEMADKYQEDQLKKECLHFMMKTINVDNFCDFIVLALRHDEQKLFQNAIELFLSNVKEIIRSLKWQIFMKEYPTQANELFIKTVDHYDT